MSDHTTLRLAEEVLKAFEDRLAFNTEEIRHILEGEEELLTRCLDFLVGRDELLMAAGTPPTFYHKNNVIRALLDFMRNAEAMKAEEIAEGLAIPVATTCEVLGWLERDRRIQAIHEGDVIRFKCR